MVLRNRLGPLTISYLIAGIGLCVLCLPAEASPSISNVSVNGTSIGRYQRFEATFALQAVYTNPFDPVEIDVRGVFTSPTGQRLVIPGFYYQNYTRMMLPDKRQVLDRVIGDVSWKVRFAPQEIGLYSYVIEATDQTGFTSTPTYTFHSVPSSSRGFVRAQGAKLQFDNGDWLYPIGASTSWCQSLPTNQEYYSWGWGYESTYGFDRVFNEYAKYGGNWDRIWIDVGDWATPSIEGKRSYWNLYDWQIDRTVSRTGQNSAVIENYAEVRSTIGEPYSLMTGDTLIFSVDGGAPQTVIFLSSDFLALGGNINNALCSQIGAILAQKTSLITAQPSLANGNNLLLVRARPSAPSINSLQILGGTARARLGLDGSLRKPDPGRILFQYKENGGDWSMDFTKIYKFSCWIKTENVVADPGGGAYFGGYNLQYSPNLTGTRDWTYYETLLFIPPYSRIRPQGVLNMAAGRVWFDDFSLKELGSNVELGNDTSFEHMTIKVNRYNLPDSWALDHIVQMAEAKGIYLQLMIGRHDQPNDSYRKYLRYLVARWGYSTSVLSYEFENENWHDVPWHDEMSNALKALDPFNHLRTTSLWSSAVLPDLWNLPELSLVNLHYYRKDYVPPRIWGMEPGNSRLDDKEFNSPGTGVAVQPGHATLYGPKLFVEPGETYTIEYSVRSILCYGNNGGNIQTNFVMTDDSEVLAGKGPTPKDTTPWTRISYPITVPPGAKQMRFYMQSAGLVAGYVWIDDFAVINSQGVTIYWDDWEFDNYFRREDWANYGFNDGRLMRSYNFNKPILGGEHGLEHDVPWGGFIQSYIHNGLANGAPDVDPNSPDFRWDSAGVHFQNWLWGTAMGGMSGSTGMWWYVNDSHRHYLALRRFLNEATPDFVNLPSHTSIIPGEDIESTNSKVDAYGKVSPDYAYVFVLHRDSCWNRKIRDGITPQPESGEIVIKSLTPSSTYWVREWNTSYTDYLGATSPVMGEAIMTSNAQGQLRLPVVSLAGSTAFSVETALSLQSKVPNAARLYR